MRVADHGLDVARPRVVAPGEPGLALLVEDEEGLVAELRELGSPARSALDGAVLQDRAHDEDLLPVVHLVPDALEDLLEQRRVAILAVHQPRYVRQADVALLELLVREDADASLTGITVAFEGEIHLIDAVPFGERSELLLGALCGAAEQHTLLRLQDRTSWLRVRAAGILPRTGQPLPPPLDEPSSPRFRRRCGGDGAVVPGK